MAKYQLELIDHDGNPMANEPFKLVDDDGNVLHEGTLDEQGRAEVELDAETSHLFARRLLMSIRLDPGTTRLKIRKVALGDGDVLESLPLPAVAAWYGRLADLSDRNGLPLSAVLLRKWLSNREQGARLKIASHPHLVRSTAVADALHYHRSVYLSEE
jgi:hypothetical protein